MALAPSEQPQPIPDLGERCLSIAMPSLYPFLQRATRRTLRLVCRSTRTALDATPPKLYYDRSDGLSGPADVAFALAACPVRWPTAKQVTLISDGKLPSGIKALPPKLETLWLCNDGDEYGEGTEEEEEDGEGAEEQEGGQEEEGEGAALRGQRDFQLLTTVAPTLKELRLEDCNLKKRELATLAKVLSTLTSLSSLHISAEYDDFNLYSRSLLGAEHLGPALSMMTRLTQLSIRAVKSSAAMQALVPHIAALPNLEVLELPESEMGREGAMALSSALQRLAPLGKLRELDLSYGELGVCESSDMSEQEDGDMHTERIQEVGFALLAAVIRSISSLRKLDLSSNRLYHAIGQLLAEGSSTLTGLTSLNIYGNELKEHCAHVAALLQSTPLLEELDLGINGLGLELCEPGGAKLVDALCGLTSLQQLAWTRDDFTYTDGCMAQLCRVLRHLTCLVSLNLGSSRLWPAGGVALAGVLPHLAALTNLNLHSCSLGRIKLLNASSVLWNPETRTSRMVLPHLDVDAPAAKAIITALAACCRLTNLRLSGNGWSVEDLRQILEGARQLLRLRDLCVTPWCGGNCSKEDLRALVPELCALSVLQELSSLSVSYEDAAAAVDREVVQRALPQLNDLVF